MASLVAQARNAGELPPTTSSSNDSEATVHDYTLLAQLRLARGDPALPPPEEYTSLRVEAARRIRERDAQLGDRECRQAATERLDRYLRVVEQERRYYDLASKIAQRGRAEFQRMDTEGTTEEIVGPVERSVLSGSAELRHNVARIGVTAETLDLTASKLDSAARLFDTVSHSLGGTANMLNTAATSLNATGDTLENTLGVMVAQISTLNSQLLALADILQTQRSAPASPTSPGSDLIHQTALAESVRRGVENAISDVVCGAQARTSHPPPSPSGKSSSYSGSTLWEGDFLSSGTGAKGKKRSRRALEGKAGRRAAKYVKTVINRILG